MKPYTYCGWQITFNPHLPIAGQYRADRFGVGMCANSEAAIRRMIDRKVFEARQPPSWCIERSKQP